MWDVKLWSVPLLFKVLGKIPPSHLLSSPPFSPTPLSETRQGWPAWRTNLRESSQWLKTGHYSNRQTNGGTGSCLQGGVAFLWLPNKPPAPGIKRHPREEALVATTVTRTYLQTWSQETRIAARKTSSLGISHLQTAKFGVERSLLSLIGIVYFCQRWVRWAFYLLVYLIALKCGRCKMWLFVFTQTRTDVLSLHQNFISYSSFIRAWPGLTSDIISYFRVQIGLRPTFGYFKLHSFLGDLFLVSVWECFP